MSKKWDNMKGILSKILFVVTCFELLSSVQFMKAQSAVTTPMLDYHELKGLLGKHERTLTRIVSRKRFKLVSSKKRPEGTLYTYKQENGISPVIVRARKRDGLVHEVAWNEQAETVGNLTHEAVQDGFVPVAGNSQYHNRLLHMALFVYYELWDDTIIPCVLRTTQ
jgi:hypothetical protein